jgi:hypothetical protein
MENATTQKTREYFSKQCTEEGLAFLAPIFQFYIIICLKQTTIYNLSEVVEVGIVITKTDNTEPLYRYNKFIKPSILQRVSKSSNREGIKYEDLSMDFSQMLNEITSEERLIAHALQHGLLIVEHGPWMSRLFAGQCEIEQCLQKKLPSFDIMKAFDQWCSIDTIERITKHVSLAIGWKSSDYSRKISNLREDRFGCPDLLRCVDRALNVIPLIDFYTSILKRELFPTTRLSRTSGAYSIAPKVDIFEQHYTYPLQRNITPIHCNAIASQEVVLKKKP